MAEMFIMAIDQGTTSSRAIIFNHAGQIVSSGQLEHEQRQTGAGPGGHESLHLGKNGQHACQGAEPPVHLDHRHVTTVRLGPGAT